MLHLDPERLAALADGELPPTPDEAGHVAACAECARDLAAHREILAMAARERTAVLAEPLTDWDTLSARLERDGLLRTRPGAGSRGWARPRPWLQVAAALAIAFAGGAVGRLSASRSAAGGTGSDSASIAGASLASQTPDSGRALVTVDDALALMRRAESDYRIAAAFVAAHDTVTPGPNGVDRYRARLAALDRVSDAALAGVNQAPADPVLNQYLISARTARALTLQQLNSALPAGMRLASY